MTSPVDTSVKFWSSLMDGVAKPTISGALGSYIALIDALIAGFDSKSCTINVAGGVATVAWSGLHSCMTDTVVLISGATGAWTDLNGEQKITAKTPGAASATFATALGNGAATGSITIAMAPLPYWTKVFAGTNLAAYRSLDPLSNGFFHRIDDTNYWIRCIGYETMTDVNTGLGLFPTTALLNGGTYSYKSNLIGAAVNPWVVFADSRSIHFMLAANFQNGAGGFHGPLHGFGDGVATRPGGDPWISYMSGTNASALSSGYGGLDSPIASGVVYVPRNYTGLGSSYAVNSWPFSGSTNLASGADSIFGSFPSPLDGIMRLSPRVLAQSGFIRAWVPGVYHAPHSLVADSFRFGDRVTGSGSLAGKRFFVINPPSTTWGGVTQISSASCGASFIDVVGPWR